MTDWHVVESLTPWVTALAFYLCSSGFNSAFSHKVGGLDHSHEAHLCSLETYHII